MRMLSKQQEDFCKAMVTGINHKDAYVTCFPAAIDMTDEQIAYKSKVLMGSKSIRTRIKEMRDAVARNTVFNGAKVVEEWVKIATADASELVQLQRVNCRCCHGTDGKYQWRNPDEYAFSVAKAIDKGQRPPNDEGGYGFMEGGEINESCLNCSGEGIERLFYFDTRDLSEGGKRLYDGIKPVQGGFEIKLRNRDTALLNLAKYFKILVPENNKEDDGEGFEINITGGLP